MSASATPLLQHHHLRLFLVVVGVLFAGAGVSPWAAAAAAAAAEAPVEAAQEEEDATGLVFVPEYNVVECEKIQDKRKCRREREACLWVNSEKRCAKREQPISEHPGL